jgi:O-antigen ligase
MFNPDARGGVLSIASPVGRAVSFTDTPVLALAMALITTVMLVSGLVDLPSTVSAGSISAQAILTICYFAASLFLTPLLPTSTSLFTTTLFPLVVFVLWAVTSLAWTSAMRQGLQNVLVLFILLMMIRTAAAAAASSPGFVLQFQRRLQLSTILSGAFYAFSVLWFGLDSSDLIGARSFGLFAVLGVAYYLSCWRYGQRSGLLRAVLLTLLIGASLSRLALGIAITLFPISQVPSRGFSKSFRMLVVLGIVLAVSIGSVVYVDALQERFLTGDVSLKIGSLAINGSGRAAYWRVTIDSFLESPIWGNGAGSSEGLIESYFAEMRHSHSDYLRVANDYGLIGASLWAAAIGTLLAKLFRSWRRADRLGNPNAKIHLAAVLALVAFVLEMSTDNAMVYVFVVAPLALLIGTSLGTSTSASS